MAAYRPSRRSAKRPDAWSRRGQEAAAPGHHGRHDIGDRPRIHADGGELDRVLRGRSTGQDLKSGAVGHVNGQPTGYRSLVIEPRGIG